MDLNHVGRVARAMYPTKDVWFIVTGGRLGYVMGKHRRSLVNAFLISHETGIFLFRTYR